MNRDPIEEKGGVAIYLLVSNEPINNLDPHGLKVAVGGSGIRYRVPIDSLNLHQTDRGYSLAVIGYERFLNDQRMFRHNEVSLSTSGPNFIKNTAYLAEVTKEGTYAVAYFLIFVDFEVCFDNETELEVRIHEKRHRKHWGTVQGGSGMGWIYDLNESAFGAPKVYTYAGHGSFTSSTTPVGAETNVRLSPRERPLGSCRHTIIVADMPAFLSQLKPNAADRSEPNFVIGGAEQRVEVIDRGTGRAVGAITHSFSIGFNQNGTLVATP